jgi:hypothetical protein
MGNHSSHPRMLHQKVDYNQDADPDEANDTSDSTPVLGGNKVAELGELALLDTDVSQKGDLTLSGTDISQKVLRRVDRNHFQV